MRRIFILEARKTDTVFKRFSTDAQIVEPLEDTRVTHKVTDPQLIKSINQDAALSGKNLTEYLMANFALKKDEPYWFVWDGRLYPSFSGQRVHI